MPQKKHKPEEIVAKLRRVDVRMSQGQSVAEAVRSIGVNQFTCYRWRKEFGGLKTDQVKWLKELEKENDRLRKAVSELTLGKLILREAASGDFAEARIVIEGWRHQYNTKRPHSSLGYRPPAPEVVSWPAPPSGAASSATPAVAPDPSCTKTETGPLDWGRSNTATLSRA